MKTTSLSLIILSSLQVAFVHSVYCQSTPSIGINVPKLTGKRSVSGVVLDSLTNKGIDYTSIKLLRNTGSIVDGTICDEKGNFKLNKIEEGNYTMIFEFLGYTTKTITVQIPSGKGQFDIGEIKLVQTSKKLDEVIVAGEKDIVETKIDRIIYNADRDISNAGGSALDVLRKAPMVSVDLNGKVQLRGSNNIRVLINGKPSGIFASNINDALSQIQADQIKEVEIITNPSSKYDAEGTGGIINIVLKKSLVLGFTSTFNSSLGTRTSTASVNSSYRKEKLAISMNLGGNAFYTRRSSELNRSEYGLSSQTELAYLKQNRFQRNLGSGAYAQVGLDYTLSEHDAINASLRGNIFSSSIFNLNNSATINSLYHSNSAPNNLDNIYYRQIINKNYYDGLDFNIGYTKQFSGDRQLTALALYSNSFNKVDYSLNQASNIINDYSELGNNASPYKEYTLQIDYSHPFDKNNMLETGVKGIARKVNSNYAINYDSTSSNNFLIDRKRSDSYAYDQNVYAAYASYKLNFAQRNTMQLGLRVEDTRTEGLFLNNTSPITNNYFNWIPNIAFARDFGKDKTTLLRASFTRRIQRPSIYYLNPFVNLQDSRNAITGNPFLNAEMTNSYELGFSTKVKNLSINAVAFARVTNASIQDVSRLVPSVSLDPLAPDKQFTRLTTYQNISHNASYGISISNSLKITPNLSVSTNLNPSVIDFESVSLNIRKSALVGNASANIRWVIKGYISQVNYNLYSRDIYTQGYTSGFQTHSVSVRKDLPNKHCSLTISVDNPFQQIVKLSDYQNAPGISSTNVSDIYLRGVRLSFSYFVGKKQKSESKFNKSLNNNDQKEGRNDNQ